MVVSSSIKRRLFWTFGGLAILFGGALVAREVLRQALPRFAEEEFLGSNLAFFVVINVNIIVLLLLGYLIIKNVAKLIFDRRHNILGSKLRTRLVTAFVGLSLIPSVLLFMVAKGIVGSIMQGWFDPQVAATVEGAVGVARYHYREREQSLLRETARIAQEISGQVQFFDARSGEAGSLDGGPLARLLEERRAELGLLRLEVVDEHGQLWAGVADLGSVQDEVTVPGLHSASLKEAISGQAVVRPEQSVNAELFRSYAPIVLRIEQFSEPRQRFALVATERVSPELNGLLTRIIDSYDDYRELGIYRRPLASSYLLSLAVVTLLVVFGAVWVGFFLARSLTVPIQSLAQGTGEVAHGNLGYRIPEVGDDELSVLVRSFNKMTEDLQKTTGELVERRRYMETVLENVGVGVIAVDAQLKVATLNYAAAEMLGISAVGAALNRNLFDAVPLELSNKVKELLEQLQSSVEKVCAENISIYLEEGILHLQVTVTRLVGDGGLTLGAVVLLDDLTELVSAQRMAAWREVARRIAHEIKNPLTPIQLSAQRIQRRFAALRGPVLPGDSERAVVAECTEIIVNQVEALRGLVNEFSQFARMPKADPRPVDLNRVVLESVRMFEQAHADLKFEVELDPEFVTVELDREQIGRVLVNLMDNSVASVRQRLLECGASRGVGVAPESGRIVVRTMFDHAMGMIALSVTDNGIGVPDSDKPKLFEPYFSTKKGGTGLGLAIVGSIVADHNGFVRVRDNKPFGVSVVVQLPLRQVGVRVGNLS